jgi:hypothetical protein
MKEGEIELWKSILNMAELKLQVGKYQPGVAEVIAGNIALV